MMEVYSEEWRSLVKLRWLPVHWKQSPHGNGGWQHRHQQCQRQPPGNVHAWWSYLFYNNWSYCLRPKNFYPTTSGLQTHMKSFEIVQILNHIALQQQTFIWHRRHIELLHHNRWIALILQAKREWLGLFQYGKQFWSDGLVNHIIRGYVQLPHYSRTRRRNPDLPIQPLTH